jgi:hypothetical protein
MGDHDGLESVITIGWNAHPGARYPVGTVVNFVCERA